MNLASGTLFKRINKFFGARLGLLAMLGMFFSLAFVAESQAYRYHLAEGSTGRFEEDILLANPSGNSVPVTLTFMTSPGTTYTQSLNLLPTSRQTVSVNRIAGLSSAEVSAFVDSPQPIIVERSMFWWDGQKQGGHSARAVLTGATTWYLAEGCTGYFQTFILLSNPTNRDALVLARFLKPDGTEIQVNRTVPAHSRQNIWANGDADVRDALKDSAFSTIVQSQNDVPIIVERAMYWGSNWEGGHDSQGIKTLSTDSWFAEGFVGGAVSFNTFFLLANFSSQYADVEATFYLEDGSTPITRYYTVAPHSRADIWANTIPELANKSFSTHIRTTNNVGIAVERAMYWGDSWTDGHVAVGGAASGVIGFAEGRSGSVDGSYFNTYFLILNGYSTTMNVRGTFIREDGTGVVTTFNVPPQSRYTYLPEWNLELVNQRFSAVFESTDPSKTILAERSMYWGPGWTGGSSCEGSAYPGTVATPQPPPATDPPAMTPAPDISYTAAITVALTARPGAIIRYTTDGSEPTEASAVYGSAIPISSYTLLKARAYLPGYSPSAIATGTYRFQASAPTFNPAGGTYSNNLSVTISTVTLSPYTIFYTDDGSVPTIYSKRYSSPIPVNRTTTLRAFVSKTGYDQSGEASAAYTLKVATPSFSPAGNTYGAAQSVTVSTATLQPDMIYYTDDNSVPTTSSKRYGGPITVDRTTTLKALVVKTGYYNSDVGSATYTMKAAAPSFTPGGNTYGSMQSITMTTTTPTPCFIYYTDDGNEPTAANSKIYSAPIQVDRTTTLKAFVLKDGFDQSGITKAPYTFKAATPTFSVEGGTYVGVKTIRMATATSSAEIRYTTDTSDPLTSPTARAFNSDLTLSPVQTITLKARAFRAGWTESDQKQATYRLVLALDPAPTATPDAGTFDEGQEIRLSGAFGAPVYYTTNGDPPTQRSTMYTGPIKLDRPMTLKAISYRDGVESEIMEKNYKPRVATPRVTPAGGVYASPVSVSAYTTTSGAMIRYTLDGVDPDASSLQLLGSISALNVVIKARGFKDAWEPSHVAAEVYVGSIPAPPSPAVITPSNGFSTASFNLASGNASFSVASATLDAETINVFRNGELLSDLNSSATFSSASAVLSEGPNQVEIYGLDAYGYEVGFSTTLWAGSKSVTVTVLDSYDYPLRGAKVTATLLDDNRVRATCTTDSSGRCTLNGLPDGSPIEFRGELPGYLPKTYTLIAGQYAGLILPLDPANNDFNQGNLYGWSVPTGYYDFLIHSEATPPWVSCLTCPKRKASSASNLSAGKTEKKTKAPSKAVSFGGKKAKITKPKKVSPKVSLTAAADNDLRVNSGYSLTPQTITRSFYTSPGVRKINVRYRYISAEALPVNVLNFGAGLPDTFQVSLTSTNGRWSSDAQTVGTLWNQFDQNGGTSWRTLSLNVGESEGVTFAATVANYADGVFPSAIDIDRVWEEGVYDIPDFQLYTDGHVERLEYLSVSPHHYWCNSGLTPLIGKITIVGPENDALKSLELLILEGGQIKATVPLADTASGLLRSFGTERKIEAPQGTTLFKWAHSDHVVTEGANGTLTLKVRASFASGAEPVIKEFGKVQKLITYPLPSNRRTGERDPDNCMEDGSPTFYPCNGDDWMRPSTLQFVLLRGMEDFGIRYNDFSNMNGGFFYPHNTHRDGIDVDCDFADKNYMKRDSIMANRLVELLNTDLGRRITKVYVTFDPYNLKPGSFMSGLVGKTTIDGRLIVDDKGDDKGKGKGGKKGVIQNFGGHVDHFHLRISP